MEKLNRLMINICSDDLVKSKEFYTKLFDFRVDYDSEWFVHLVSENNNLEIGIIDATSEIVPKDVQNQPQGMYMTFVVENVNKVFENAEAEKFQIVEPPKDTFYGQRRFLIKDPNGVIIDISAPIRNFEA
ncbi:VOC family protein [Aquimarina aquimarini]|uniref:VOC family protein n=1 Tax=Aquimarina aquimarini TaxID=1191734 RepID=UPI001F3EBF7B|nr:VOC family protein [Aquimarina aquimarini]